MNLLNASLNLRTHRPEYGTDNRAEECGVCLSRGDSGQYQNHFSTAYQRGICLNAGKTRMDCAVSHRRPGRHTAHQDHVHQLHPERLLRSAKLGRVSQLGAVHK